MSPEFERKDFAKDFFEGVIRKHSEKPIGWPSMAMERQTE
jgi:hypothetical protein